MSYMFPNYTQKKQPERLWLRTLGEGWGGLAIHRINFDIFKFGIAQQDGLIGRNTGVLALAARRALPRCLLVRPCELC